MRLPPARLVAAAVAVGRIGIGVVAMSGTKGTDLLIGPEAQEPAPQLLSKMAGIRDVAIGGATLQALRGKRPPRLLMGLATACDAVDLVTAFRTPGLGPTTKAKFAAAAGPAVVVGTWLTLARWTKKPAKA